MTPPTGSLLGSRANSTLVSLQGLAVCRNEGNDPVAEASAEEQARISALLKHLARRNLRRGYQLALPTGQALARAVGAEPLTQEELGKDNSADMTSAMQEGGFFERTPLWFYILKEAEVRGEGDRLGPLGSRIIGETIIGVLLNDPESYLSQNPTWDPSQPTPGAGGPLTLGDGRSITAISDLLTFAGVKG